MLEARIQNIIEMAVRSTTMERALEKGAKGVILQELRKIVTNLEEEGYDKLHESFCSWFQATIKTKEGRPASYGQAAKVMDTAMKVIVGYCSLPRPEIAENVRPRLHPAISSYVLKHLKRSGRPLTRIEKPFYDELQVQLKQEAKEQGYDVPINYDDILYRQEKEGKQPR